MCLYSTYRFPKDLKLQKFWAKKCEINGKWNPQTSYICSKHFSPNDFVKDMKAELSGNCYIFFNLYPDYNKGNNYLTK